MLELQNTLTDWFRQFTPNVYVLGDEYGLDPATGQPKIKPMPLISFGYPTTDFAVNGLITFNIWTESVNWIEAMSIEDRIAQALPSQSAVTFDVKTSGGGVRLEYFHPGWREWIEFTLDQAADIAQDMWDIYGVHPLETRETPLPSGGKSRGGIWLQRGNPFTQSVSDPDFMVKRRTGNIVIRSFLIH